jgi:polyisoprenyl-teichoic acid--peptidoglycan teichoic acid transferase
MSRFRTTWRAACRGLVLVAVLAAAALVVPDSAVHRTEVDLAKVRTAHAVDGSPNVMWILAVGSDARPGQDMLRSRGDALQLVGINTRTGAASAIGVPRDSYVEIPGHGREKINAALYFGGPQAMAGAIRNLVGIQADYVMVTRFPFFENMVNDIGGIDVHNPRRFYDPNLKPEGFGAGRIHLNGYGAMAFSRIRKGLSGGDFDRSANQQRTLRGIHAKIRARSDEPGFMERGVMSVMRNMNTGVGPVELFRIAQAVARVEAGKITTCVVGGSVGMAGAASVVWPNVAQARRLGNDARGDATLRGC